MIVTDIIFAFLAALIFAAILVGAFGRRGPGPAAGALFFFALLFLAVWAGGAWVTPFGPTLWGSPWLTYLALGLLLVLLFGALTEPPPRRRVPPPTQTDGETAAEVAALTIGAFFWVLILLLALAIITSYAIA